MGNCCLRRDPAAVWANDDDDDEWVSVCQLRQSEQPEENKLLGEFHFRDSSASSSSCRGSPPSSGGGDHQVKIKMTKRELEELVGSRGGAMDVSSVDELLSRAISDGENEEVEEHQGPWRPALKSIPEVD